MLELFPDYFEFLFLASTLLASSLSCVVYFFVLIFFKKCLGKDPSSSYNHYVSYDQPERKAVGILMLFNLTSINATYLTFLGFLHGFYDMIGN